MSIPILGAAFTGIRQLNRVRKLALKFGPIVQRFGPAITSGLTLKTIENVADAFINHDIPPGIPEIIDPSDTTPTITDIPNVGNEIIVTSFKIL